MFLPLDSPQILEEQLNVCDAQNPNAGIRVGIAKTYIPLLVRDADPKVTFLFLGSLSKNLRSILFANPTWHLAPLEASMDVLRSTVANVLRVRLSCKAAASVMRHRRRQAEAVLCEVTAPKLAQRSTRIIITFL